MIDPRTADERISLWLTDEAAGRFPADLLDATLDRTRAIPRRRRSSTRWASGPSRPVITLTAIGVAVAMVVLASGALLGQHQVTPVAASPRPSVGPTARPSAAPVQSPVAIQLPPLTQTFESSVNRFAIAYPEGWSSVPATWIMGEGFWMNGDPTRFDVLRPPAGTPQLSVASTELPRGVDADQWISENVVGPDGTCSTPTDISAAIVIDGYAGRVKDACHRVEATVVADGRVYFFVLSARADASNTRQVFDSLMATVQLEPPIGTSTWTAYHSSRYGLDLAYPADWIATPSRRAWTFKADAHDPSSPAMDQFRSPDGVLRVSYWSVPPGHEIGSRDDLAAWVVDYCTKTGQPCPGIHDVVTPLCVEHRDCHPALLVRFPDRVQAFAIGGVVGGDVTIVTVWRPESDPSVVRYGGATRLLEGFLATMGVYPPVLPDQP